uniref:Acetyl-coenzyme A synthetase n=1 Tax=Dermatophagoides pteronyssinus TaxID=6956 RepID=A0A6P6XTZ0_DERPT|nr:acetyl-coenzyme A synthetase, cytoplasmic-like isoform X2 [Dermatophagoides pteronyssinus]
MDSNNNTSITNNSNIQLSPTKQRQMANTNDRISCDGQQFEQTIRRQAHLKSIDEYYQLYEQSIKLPGEFWKNVARDFYWTTPLPENNDKILDYNFDINSGSIKIEFLKDVRTNITYNLLDRIINRGFGDRIAYYWEGNELNERQQVTYLELRSKVCRMANALKRMGIGIGDRVAIYLPVTIELVVAMLACARIGAIHTIVFAGFSAHSLAERMCSARVKILITADASFRGDKFLHYQPIIDEAISNCIERKLSLKSVIIVNRFDQSIHRNKNQYESIVEQYQSKYEHLFVSWKQINENELDNCEPEWLSAEHPLFILYTSGSTGKPKGVLHTVGGYMLTTAIVFKYAFNYRDGDIFFCTADLGWITGHTANVYGSLANGASIILFEGVPIHPKPDRLWTIIDEYRANIFYTAPTAIRSLMKFDDKYVRSHEMNELKLIAMVGEPINRDAWFWVYRMIGKERCPIIDTYFQTETGAPMIFPIPNIIDLKPGSATVPFFGILPVILDENGKEILGTESGFLAFKQAWPGIARTIDGDHERFESTYFERFPGYYFTGDAAYRDSDGYYWITGRTDDLLNVSGHLLSTAEIESAILKDKRIAEAASVPMPHSIKGQCICAFIVTKNGYNYDNNFEKDIRNQVRHEIGPVATPDLILNVRALPKTRSGKIIRRVLAKIACGEKSNFGDISTMTDETIIQHLIDIRMEHSG